MNQFLPPRFENAQLPLAFTLAQTSGLGFCSKKKQDVCIPADREAVLPANQAVSEGGNIFCF